MEIEHEPQATPEGVPPAYWPASGDLKVEKLSARYSPVSLLGPLVHGGVLSWPRMGPVSCMKSLSR